MPTFDLSPASPADAKADLLVLPFFAGRVAGPGVADVQGILGGDLMAATQQHGLSGKLGETFSIPTLGRLKASSVMLVGLGDADHAGPGQIRRAATRAASRGSRFATVATTLHHVGSDAPEAAHAVAEGFAMGAYRFTRYKHEEAPGLEQLIVSSDLELEGAVHETAMICDAQNRARSRGGHRCRSAISRSTSTVTRSAADTSASR